MMMMMHDDDNNSDDTRKIWSLIYLSEQFMEFDEDCSGDIGE